MALIIRTQQNGSRCFAARKMCVIVIRPKKTLRVIAAPRDGQ